MTMRNDGMNRRDFLAASAGAVAAVAGGRLGAAPKKPHVVVATGAAKMDPDKAAHQRLKAALDKLGGFPDLVKGKKVLVKLNATDKTSQDANTSPEMTRAALRLIKEHKPKSVKVIGQEWYGFDCKRKGRPTLREVIDQEGVALEELIHWWKPSDQYVKKVPKDGPWSQLWVARQIFDPDAVVINVPRLKTHHFTLYTGCVKNCIGLTWHMYAHHCTDDRNPKAGASEKHPARVKGWKLFPAKLSAAYADVYRAPVALNILDAGQPTWGWGGPKPERIHTVPAHAVIVSADALAADAYGMQLMHKQRPKVMPTLRGDWLKGDSPYVEANLTGGNYLAACAERGAGEADLGKVRIDEVKID